MKEADVRSTAFPHTYINTRTQKHVHKNTTTFESRKIMNSHKINFSGKILKMYFFLEIAKDLPHIKKS